MSKRRGTASRPKPAKKAKPERTGVAAARLEPLSPSVGIRAWRTRWPEAVTALSLAGVVLVRPFWDGVTFEYGNFYFLWVILAAFAFWGVRTLIRGGSIRFSRHLLLLGGFVVVAALLGSRTVAVDPTYRGLLLWTGYFFLFAVAANALRSRWAIGLVLGAFVVATFGETILSFIHYYFVLPTIRRQLIADPRQLLIQFSTPELTPELAHRLNINRAFGSFLFANALAAFLILGIPYFVGEAFRSVHCFREGKRLRGRPVLTEQEDVQRRVTAAVVALVFFLVAFETARWWYLRTQGMVYGPQPWNAFPGRVVLIVGVLPLLVAAVPALMIGRHGPLVGWWGVQAVFLPLVTLLSLECLRLTFSRGGFLALAGAAVAGALLAWGTGRAASRSGGGHGRTAAGAAAGALIALAVWAAPEGFAQAPPQPTAPAASAAAPAPELVVEGTNYTAKDLVNPATLWMRLQYWRIGLRIVADNFFTGVGLMNFPSVYPQYQDLAATPVKAAHNDFIQVFAETGVVGFLLFTAFWGHFLYWGFRRIRAQEDRGERWALIGLYTGLLAFLMHSFLDFNFYNPSLAMLQFLLAGVFLARCGEEAPPSGSRTRHSLILVGLLIAVALAAGASARVYRAHVLTGEERDLNMGLQAAHAIAALDPTRYRLDAPFSESYQVVSRIVPERADIEAFGTIHLPPVGSGQGYRPLEPGAEARPEELANGIVLVRHPQVARAKVIEGVKRRIEELERAHGLYPHDPDTAINLVHWHNFLREIAADPAEKRTHVLAMLRWAEIAVSRNSKMALLRSVLGDALLRRAEIETDPRRQREYTDQAMRAFREATVLAPTSPEVWEELSRRSLQYAESLRKVDAVDEAAQREAEGRRAAERARQIRNAG